MVFLSSQSQTLSDQTYNNIDWLTLFTWLLTLKMTSNQVV